MKLFKNLSILWILTLSLLWLNQSYAEWSDIASKQVFPTSINTSSIWVWLEKIYLYDQNISSVFWFKDTDTSTWVKYTYKWANVSNIFLKWEFHKEATLKIEMFRNGRIVDTVEEKLWNTFEKNVVVDWSITTDEIKLTIYIPQRSNISEQNYATAVSLL